MKKMTGSLWIKVLAIFLLVLFSVTCAASALGVVALAACGAYPGNYETARGEVTESICSEYSSRALDMYLSHYEPDTIYANTNFRFTVGVENGEVLYDNLKGEKTLCETTCELRWYTSKTDSVIYRAPDSVTYTVTGYILAEQTEQDDILFLLNCFDMAYGARYMMIVFGLICFVLGVFVFIFLMSAAGHRSEVEGITPNFVDKIPFDVFTAAIVLLMSATAVMSEVDNPMAFIVLGTVMFVYDGLLLLLWLMSMATRIKLGTLIKGCLIYKIIAFLWRTFKKFLSFIGSTVGGMKLIPKASLIIFGVLLIEFIYVCSSRHDTGAQLFGWFVDRAVLTALTVYVLLGMKKLLTTGKELAAGNMDSTVDLTKLRGPLKEHGESLNNIRSGLTKAVDERMKSERFKTELITNVSHDIKTPLTSIINYVDLMEKEEPESEKLREYLAVLSRQSARLKKLIDDLLEASKASTGSLTVTPERCELGVLLDQTAGEYAEKLEKSGLELVLSKPEEPVVIMADGRHMWRILDNLMNNVCKYAQCGTRVYFDLKRSGLSAVITLRNISASMLNVSGDELMERFVRGDISRSTEGSGLGLSIAKSLVQLQNGELELTVDGDLFKVTMKFKTV